MLNLAHFQSNQTNNSSPITSFSSPIKMNNLCQSQMPTQQQQLTNINPFTLNASTTITPQISNTINPFILKTPQSQFEQNILRQQINSLLIQKEKQEQQQIQQKMLIDALINQIQNQQNQQIQQQQRQILLQQINLPTQNYLKYNEEISNPNSNSSSMTNINTPQVGIYNMEHKLSISSFPSCDNIKREDDSLFYPTSAKAFSQQQPINFFTSQQLVQQQIQQQQMIHQKLINPINTQNLFGCNLIVPELNIKRKFEELDSSSQSPSCESSIQKKKIIGHGEEELCLSVKQNSLYNLMSHRNTITSSTLPNTPTIPTLTKSKSEIKKEELKDPRSRSRFHNLTKLFLNSLLSIFTRENMMKINIDSHYQEEIIKCIAKVKQSGRKTQGKVCKTDLFNHSHYNVLFLKLTPESIREVANKPKDANIHKLCFDIDVNLPIPQYQIDHINTMKKYIFEITQSVLGNPVESDSVRDEYWLRAMVGIKQLSEGKLIYRFQSIASNQSSAFSLNTANKDNSNEVEGDQQESN